MSDFLARLQARLNRQLQSTTEKTSAPGVGSSAWVKIEQGANEILQKLRSQPNLSMPQGLRLHLHPALVVRPLQYLGMAITTMAITYWLLQWWQPPSVPLIAPSSAPISNNKNNVGITLYANQDGTTAYDLFGSKPLSTDTIFLRGVVATGKNANGSLAGFAIFEVDGKPTNAIGIGESLGKGLTLQSIGDESATLLYQGQKLEFKLSKPSGQKASNPKNK